MVYKSKVTNFKKNETNAIGQNVCDINKDLIAFCDKSGLSIAEIAALVGVSAANLQSWYDAVRVPTFRNEFRVLEGLRQYARRQSYPYIVVSKPDNRCIKAVHTLDLFRKQYDTVSLADWVETSDIDSELGIELKPMRFVLRVALSNKGCRKLLAEVQWCRDNKLYVRERFESNFNGLTLACKWLDNVYVGLLKNYLPDYVIID